MTTSLVSRLAAVPGLVRPGISHLDMKTRLPLHPLSVENAYGDPRLLPDLAEPGAVFAEKLGVELIVGAETGGIPLATSVALAADLPFAFVRKPGYVGHEDHEPTVRGASVAGKHVLLVDDAVAQGTALQAFTRELVDAGATVSGVFTVVDMREVSGRITPTARHLPIESVATYLQVLTAATEQGMLDPKLHELAVDALIHHWPDNDPRWTLLNTAPAA
ncbi:phosphoribosyltransferase family protein [Kribbella sp. NPDC000426]|uniref:orotate phosphoribosyltransferase n=1 Tax=Kribbella sp. NPDC000426 TaxID=3154255 RepID=UPI0033288374